MKAKRFAVLALTVLFCSQPILHADDWTSIKSYEGNFKAMLPGEPDYSASKVDTEVGKIDLHSFAVEANGGRVAYFVFYSDYPEGTEDDTDPKVLLQNARDGVIGDDDSRQTREEKIDISGHPGLEFDFVQGNGANKTYGYWRLYMVKNRLYQIGIISIGEPATDFKVKAIYDSFNLLKP